jgi:hypothetical protein
MTWWFVTKENKGAQDGSSCAAVPEILASELGRGFDYNAVQPPTLRLIQSLLLAVGAAVKWWP